MRRISLKRGVAKHLIAAILLAGLFCTGAVVVWARALSTNGEGFISPATAIPEGKAPTMAFKLIESVSGERVFAITFYKGDEVLSGLIDFVKKQKIGNAHFTGIGAVSSATVGWLNLAKKGYHPIHVNQQVEVLSLVGDVAEFQGTPQIHMHTVLGKPDGTTLGGHVWELNTNPTVEIFLTANDTNLIKRPDTASGMKFIDPEH